jgi:20S proteasome subunit alpha 3
VRAGRLFQVEYALQAINNAAAAVGVLSEFGVIIAAEKKVSSALLAPPKTSEKMYKLDDHVCAAVAGLTSGLAGVCVRCALVCAPSRHFFLKLLNYDYLA